MHYGAFSRIKANTTTGDDLREIIRLFAPQLSIKPQYPFYTQHEKEPGLSSVCRREFETRDHPSFEEFLKELPSDSPDLWALLRLANGAMIDALILARDASLAAATYDTTTYEVPSINHHGQNEHHKGFLPIVRLCAELWLRLLPLVPSQAQVIAQCWKHGGFAVTTRLWLFSLRSDSNHSDDHIVDTLLALRADDFWAHRKEVMELLRDRTRHATPEKITRLADRIIAGPVFREVCELEDQQGIKYSYCWVYISALKLGREALPANAQAALDQIDDRRNSRGRELEESDYFSTWFSERRGPIGDPQPIAEAPPEERIAIAADLERTDAFNQMDAWRVYCRHDPEGAFDAVIASSKVAGHVKRWRDVLWAITDIGDETQAAKERGSSLCAKAFSFLRGSSLDDLSELTHPLVDLYVYAIKINAPLEQDCWDWLWRCSVAHEREFDEPSAQKDSGYELVSRSTNSPSGKLARLIINRLGPEWKDHPKERQDLIAQRFEQMLSSQSSAGTLSHAIIVEFILWFDARLPNLVEKYLLPSLNADNNEGQALRAVLVGLSRGYGKGLRAKLKDSILRGIRECRGKNTTATNAASRLIAYAVDDLSRAEGDPARLRPGLAKEVLAAASPHIRAAAAQVMADWLASAKDPAPHDTWKSDFSKIFRTIWPADRASLSQESSVPLAKLTMAAGDAFPEALDAVIPYIKPIRSDWPPLFFASRDEAAPLAQRFPRQVLRLLWALLRPADQGRSPDLAKVLDRIAAADPILVRDRRFQLLESRAMRLG